MLSGGGVESLCVLAASVFANGKSSPPARTVFIRDVVQHSPHEETPLISPANVKFLDFFHKKKTLKVGESRPLKGLEQIIIKFDVSQN